VIPREKCSVPEKCNIPDHPTYGPEYWQLVAGRATRFFIRNQQSAPLTWPNEMAVCDICYRKFPQIRDYCIEITYEDWVVLTVMEA